MNRHLPITLVIVYTALASAVASAEPVYHPGTTRKVLQLTGEFDSCLRMPTLGRTESRAGVVGTDLGSSFEHSGRLVVLFGDTIGRPGDADSFAFSESTDPWSMTLTFPLAADGKFQPIAPEGIARGAFCVPTGGISAGGAMYVVYTTDWDEKTGNMTRSVMLRSRDDGRTWTRLYDVSRATPGRPFDAKFINVALDRDPASPTIYVWGSGAYRKSSPWLARLDDAGLADKSRWSYFTGIGADGQPTWGAGESDAIPLFDHPVIGEFSVASIKPLGRWVMLYNSEEPRGIVMRTAIAPWGPYSAPQVIMDPWKDGAYGLYMHAAWDRERRDRFHDPGGENKWGGEYGPYLVPRFARGDANRCELFYTMSTWNPYQAVLMRSVVGEPVPEPPVETDVTTTVVGDAGWKCTSRSFLTRFTREGKPGAMTFVPPLGDKAMGLAWCWLPRDGRNRQLRFTVHGGHGEVLLVEGGGDIPMTSNPRELYDGLKSGKFGRVVACAMGTDSNDAVVPVNWSLTPFDGADLKVVLVDVAEDPWGFISVSEIALERARAIPETP